MTLANSEDRRNQIAVELKIVADVSVVVAVRLVEKVELIEIAGEGFRIEDGPLLPDRIEGTRLGGHGGFKIAVGKVLVAAEVNRVNAIGARGVERVEVGGERDGSGKKIQKQDEESKNIAQAGARGQSQVVEGEEHPARIITRLVAWM